LLQQKPWNRFLIERTGIALAAFAMLCGCGPRTFETLAREGFVAKPDISRALNDALSWPAPSDADAIAGARLLRDGPLVPLPQLAIARAVLRTNPRITAVGALILAGKAVRSARRYGLPPEFLAATLLQESAFDRNAISAAGAAGIAQFEIGTADDLGVDPFDPDSAIDGCARLLASLVRAYGERYDDPFGMALAAYNAGPAAVERYGGVPPYPETREYVELVFERWARIGSYERPGRTQRHFRGIGGE
jgi:soluble lytic murein transglycosylase-like protein